MNIRRRPEQVSLAISKQKKAKCTSEHTVLVSLVSLSSVQKVSPWYLHFWPLSGIVKSLARKFDRHWLNSAFVGS